VTVAGGLSAAFVLLRVTTAPLEGAAELNVTVTVALAPEGTGDGVTAIALTVGSGSTVTDPVCVPP
jgi:hypothetical protein